METTHDDSSGAIRRFLTHCRTMTARDRRNARRANWWLLAWMLSFAATIFAISRQLIPGGLPTYLAIAGSTLLGFVGVLAFFHFLRQADELQRKIQLEALALGFGGGFLATFTLSLLERTGLEVDLGDPFLAMVLLYVAGILLGARRYA